MVQPVGEKERIKTLDIIRGFSLIGIILVNILAFIAPLPHAYDLSQWFTDAKDIIYHQYIEIYVQSSFYPLFSMLFGYGFYMQYKKATECGVLFSPYAYKRIVVLFVIGMFHAVFIWWGDILASYAFCAAFLVMFLRLKAGWMVTAALLIYTFFQGSYLLLLQLVVGVNSEVSDMTVDIMQIQNSITAYGTGSWVDALQQRLVDLSIQMSPMMWIMSLGTILPYMLIGAALSQWGLIERAKERMKVWIIMAIIFIPLGLFIKNAPILYTRTYLLDHLKVYLGGPMLALGYIAGITLICLLPWSQTILSPLSKLGRMSLTMYLMQSIVLTTLFYNYGFGLYGKVDVELSIIIALAIVAVQMILAELWLMKFKQGPVEFFVKKMVYGRKSLSEK